jgi:hypothetical protein
MDLERQSMASLNVRLWLGDQMLRWIRTDPEAREDPRAPAALDRLKEQMKQLHAEVARRKRVERERNGEPEPEPVTVGLKMLSLTARRW